MKNQAFRMLMVLGVAGLLALPSVYAQSYGGPSLMAAATIPFQFRVGEKAFPAGDYRVSKYAPTVILIQSARSGESKIVLTHSTQTNVVPEHGKLVFNCYGDRCFLSRIWTAGSLDGNALPKSNAELEMARNSSIRENVQVALIRR
jgi:hypothetical protein